MYNELCIVMFVVVLVVFVAFVVSTLLHRISKFNYRKINSSCYWSGFPSSNSSYALHPPQKVCIIDRLVVDNINYSFVLYQIRLTNEVRVTEWVEGKTLTDLDE